MLRYGTISLHLQVDLSIEVGVHVFDSDFRPEKMQRSWNFCSFVCDFQNNHGVVFLCQTCKWKWNEWKCLPGMHTCALVGRWALAGLFLHTWSSQGQQILSNLFASAWEMAGKVRKLQSNKFLCDSVFSKIKDSCSCMYVPLSQDQSHSRLFSLGWEQTISPCSSEGTSSSSAAIV